MNRYSAEDVARILRTAGFDISKRTVSYYAYEKKMFELKETGKRNFTDIEIDKIQAILLLRERANLNLEEIKDIINSYSLEEIKRLYPKINPQFKSFTTRGIKQTFDIQIFDNHIILLVDDRKVLLGTGATRSIGNSSFYFLQQKYVPEALFMGVSIKEISELLGTRVDLLLSGDILKDYYFIVDMVEKKATFSTTPLNFAGQALAVEMILNIPVVGFELGGLRLKAFLDTGAKMSYLRKEVTNNYPVVGKEKDFYPGVGTYETEVFEIPVKLSENNISLRFGVLPEFLDKLLLFAGCDGILGFDLFRYFGAAYFNLSGRLIMLSQRAIPLA